MNRIENGIEELYEIELSLEGIGMSIFRAQGEETEVEKVPVGRRTEEKRAANCEHRLSPLS